LTHTHTHTHTHVRQSVPRSVFSQSVPVCIQATCLCLCLCLFLTQKKNGIQGSRAPLTSKLHQSVSEVLSAMHIRHLNEVRWCNSETCVHMSLRGSLSYMCAYLNVCPLVLYLRRFLFFLFLHVCILECMSVGALLVRWCFTYVEMHVDMLAYVF
jgi:hypothetical protein